MRPMRIVPIYVTVFLFSLSLLGLATVLYLVLVLIAPYVPFLNQDDDFRSLIAALADSLRRCYPRGKWKLSLSRATAAASSSSPLAAVSDFDGIQPASPVNIHASKQRLKGRN